MNTTDILFVLDKTAKAPHVPREHDLLLDDGRVTTYRFEENKPLEMPRAHAVRFGARDPNFEIFDVDGNRVDFSANKAKPAEGHVAPTIPHGCCIARFEELTADSLVVRANAEKGGLTFSKRTTKDALVSFLTEATYNPEPKPDADRVGGSDADDLPASEVDDLLGEDIV